MVTEAQIEHKTDQKKGPRAPRSRIELEGQHALNLERVAQAYGLQPDEVVAYLLEREIGPVEPIGVCVQCRMLQDRVQHQNQRIQNQRRELKRLNLAMRLGAIGSGKRVDQAARMAISALDRWMAFNAAWTTEGPDAENFSRAIRRVLTQFLSKSHHSWYGLAHVLGEASEDVTQNPKTLLSDVTPGEW